jgi:hypothetical protein
MNYCPHQRPFRLGRYPNSFPVHIFQIHQNLVCGWKIETQRSRVVSTGGLGPDHLDIKDPVESPVAILTGADFLASRFGSSFHSRWRQICAWKLLRICVYRTQNTVSEALAVTESSKPHLSPSELQRRLSCRSLANAGAWGNNETSPLL